MRSHLFPNKYRVSSTRLPHQDYGTPGGYFVTICTNNWVTFLGDVVDVTMQLSKIGQIVDRFWREIPDHFESVSIDEYVVMPNHIHGIVVIERYRDYDPPIDNGYSPTDSGVATEDGCPPFDDVAITDNGCSPNDNDVAANKNHPPTDNGASNNNYPPTDSGVETLQCNVSTRQDTDGMNQQANGAIRDMAQQQRRMSQISPKPSSLGAIIRSYKSAVTRWCRKNGYDQFAWQPRFYGHIIRTA